MEWKSERMWQLTNQKSVEESWRREGLKGRVPLTHEELDEYYGFKKAEKNLPTFGDLIEKLKTQPLQPIDIRVFLKSLDGLDDYKTRQSPSLLSDTFLRLVQSPLSPFEDYKCTLDVSELNQVKYVLEERLKELELPENTLEGRLSGIMGDVEADTARKQQIRNTLQGLADAKVGEWRQQGVSEEEIERRITLFEARAREVIQEELERLG